LLKPITSTPANLQQQPKHPANKQPDAKTTPDNKIALQDSRKPSSSEEKPRVSKTVAVAENSKKSTEKINPAVTPINEKPATKPTKVEDAKPTINSKEKELSIVDAVETKAKVAKESKVATEIVETKSKVKDSKATTASIVETKAKVEQSKAEVVELAEKVGKHEKVNNDNNKRKTDEKSLPQEVEAVAVVESTKETKAKAQTAVKESNDPKKTGW